MIHISPHRDLELLAGSRTLKLEPREPYDPSVCKFLDALSRKLKEKGKSYPDVLSFAFWCRKGNLHQLKENFAEARARIGLGHVFHITPSNVPINFAFSYVFGLLSGNSNLVRVPSKLFPQVSVVCDALQEMFMEDRYSGVYETSAFVRYSKNDEITSHFSVQSHARIIWGGDEAIRHIRTLPSMERTVDIPFADRYSICVMDAPSVMELSDTSLKTLANHFYNDTYLTDQNACSSPHLIIWQGTGKSDAKRRFWNAVTDFAKSKYQLEHVHVVDKYTQFCENLIEGKEESQLKIDNEFVYRVNVTHLDSRADHLRGKFGLFYECEVDSIKDSDLLPTIVNNKYQTVTYFGVENKELLDIVRRHHLVGVDRIVPVGKALDMGVFWDGFDIVRTLSRVIHVQ